MNKIRKHILVFLFCSICSCALSLNAMAHTPQASAGSDKACEALTEKDTGRTKNTAGPGFKNCFGGLSLLEYRTLLQTLQNLEAEYCAESAVIALEKIRTILKSADMLSEKISSPDIGISTIIGIPVGLPLYLLSELLYSIALALQNSHPEIGIIFYFASIVLAYFGTFLIL